MTINISNVNIGTSASDGSGDPLRVAFNKINHNFANIASGQLDAGNVSYTMGNSANWDYSVTTISQALDQIAFRLTQANI
jgi:hypothetical protein